MAYIDGAEILFSVKIDDDGVGGGGKNGLSIYTASIEFGKTAIAYEDVTIPVDRELQAGDLLIDANDCRLYRVVMCLPKGESSNPVMIEHVCTLANISGSGGGVYYITATHNEDNELVIDKTMSDIVEAVENGYMPFIRYVEGTAEHFFPLKFITDDKASAAFASFENGIEHQIFIESDEEETWVLGECVFKKEYALKSGILQNDSTLYIEVYDTGNGLYFVGKNHTEIEEAYNSGRTMTVVYTDVRDSSICYLPLGSRLVTGTVYSYVFTKVIVGTEHSIVLNADTSLANYPAMNVQEVKEVTVQIDNEEVVQNVLDALPTWEGGNY